MDLMLVTATEDIDENQIFFENASKRFQIENKITDCYELDSWEIFTRIEGEFDEREKISNRQRAIRRIQNILQKIPSDK